MKKGRLYVVPISFAGNVTSAKGPGAYNRWRVLAFQAVLTCDATVATRQLAFQLYDGSGNKLSYVCSGAGTTASQVSAMAYGPVTLSGGTLQASDSGANNNTVLGGSDIWVPAGSYLTFKVTAGVVGDAVVGKMVVEEYPD